MVKIPATLHEILGELSPRQRRLFACDCAEHVLPYFERFQPHDQRPWIAIEVSRQYALGKASLAELDVACGDAESAAWSAGDAAAASIPVAIYPHPQDAAAATAEGCSLADLESAVEAAANTAVEVVVTAAVGIQTADAVWSGDWETLAPTQLQSYREAEALERAWQLGQARNYLAMNSETQ